MVPDSFAFPLPSPDKARACRFDPSGRQPIQASGSCSLKCMLTGVCSVSDVRWHPKTAPNGPRPRLKFGHAAERALPHRHRRLLEPCSVAICLQLSDVCVSMPDGLPKGSAQGSLLAAQQKRNRNSNAIVATSVLAGLDCWALHLLTGGLGGRSGLPLYSGFVRQYSR